MSATILTHIPEVDIEASGVFKYILVKVSAAPKEQDENSSKVIVRGYGECNFHADVNDKLTDELQKLKQEGTVADWRTKVLGGGRIVHDSSNKNIKVYGYSQAYGKADHEMTVSLLKKIYDDYDISWSDEGY